DVIKAAANNFTSIQSQVENIANMSEENTAATEEIVATIENEHELIGNINETVKEIEELQDDLTQIVHGNKKETNYKTQTIHIRENMDIHSEGGRMFPLNFPEIIVRPNARWIPLLKHFRYNGMLASREPHSLIFSIRS